MNLYQIIIGRTKDKACLTLCCSPFVRRYTRSEPFTALNVDVRFQRHLFESLEAFVKGDLLEGNNAYQCEKCNKKVGKVWGVWQVGGLDPPPCPTTKVDTVKRLCIKKLPKVLVIQLKRFDYDWERYVRTPHTHCHTSPQHTSPQYH